MLIKKYEVLFTKKALKDLENLRVTPYYQIIKDTISQLVIDPFLGDVKKLVSFPGADYRRRIGRYRILFDIDFEKNQIHILRIIHRQGAY